MSREHRLLYRLEYTGNLLVVGPRRSGKTTLLKLLAYDLIVNRRVDSRRVVYVSCEPLYDHRDLIELFRLLDREGVRFIFLDEVTFVEGWEKAVKYYLDSKLRLGKVLYATGSTTA
ncbi:MAG: ATP-binding protein, partial [Thermoproteota archaeon]